MTYPEIAADRRRMYEATGDARHLVYERTVKSLISQRGIMSPEIQKPYYNIWQLQGGMYIDTHQLIAGRINRPFEYPAGDETFKQYRACFVDDRAWCGILCPAVHVETSGSQRNRWHLCPKCSGSQ